MNEACKNIRPLLVEYADGELPDDRVAAISAHLADCAACRAELRLLEDSLSLAREVWQEAVSDQKIASPSPLEAGPAVGAVRSRFRQKALLAGGIALCAAIVLVAIGFSLISTGKSPSIVKRSNPLPASEGTVVPNIPQDIDAMEYIAREGRTARLAASMQMLATEPNLKQYKDNAERYLRENYADTTAVKMLDK